jgi:hypothetical protein
LKPAAIVGWSGAGRLEDIERTVVHKLALRRSDAERIGGTLLVSSKDPVAIARSLSLLPGVSWIAVGFRFSGTEGYLRDLQLLATRYLPKGGKFRISAQVTASGQTAGDVVLAGNSALLSSTPGAKVDESRPRVRFRVSIEGRRGACGAEIRAGPGGVPSGSTWVACLVSGGERSSAMAWMAALAGFSIRLVHSRADEYALRQVARLYSELSHRMDPRCLELVVLDGGKNPFGRIGGWLRDHKGAAFAGMRLQSSGSSADLAKRFPNLALPLVLVQDEAVSSTYRSLGIGRTSKADRGAALTLGTLEDRGKYSERRYGGVQADSNAVIDAMKRPG